MGMMDEEAFGGRPLARIFLAVTVAEARRVEAVLDEHGMDYFVRVESAGRTLFGSLRHAAAFIVDAGQADYCEGLLVEAGLGAGLTRDDPSEAGPGG